MAEAKKKKPYLYEVDFLRIIFISGVLLNHVTSMMGGYIVNESWEQEFLDMTHLSLHFTRMGFMFITGLVLFLQHYNKDMHIWSFWKKRYLGVLIPFVSWTFIILMLDMLIHSRFSWGTFWPRFGYLVTHGTDYYMYYIMVTLQLYLVFPLLVWLSKRFNKHHWHILFISFLVQILLLVFLKYGMPHLHTSDWPFLLKNYGFNLLVYQFYFVLGGFASIHYAEFIDFIKRNHGFIGWMTIILAIGTVGEFWYNQTVLGLTLKKTLEIHQPYIFVYDLFIIGFIIWLGQQYVTYRENGLPKWFVAFVSTGAKISFGIYLSQTVALWIVEAGVSVLNLPTWGNFLMIPLVFALTVAVGYGISYVAFKLPPFGFLVGRPQWHLSDLWRKQN